MSMLAEPRKKQKISPDPRNLFWSNDDSKFGQRMLQKMGWEPGKGLGSQENGCKEHITVTLKNDYKGVGCSQKYDSTWIAHQDDFADLLTSLNENHEKEESHVPRESHDKVMSLEEKSMKAKGRVHYKKFTKGKDLSQRTEKDMGCIFGSRRHVKPESSNVTGNPDSDGEKEGDTTRSSTILTITSTDSMQTYFAKKKAELKKARQQIVEHDDVCVLESSSCEHSDKLLASNQVKSDQVNTVTLAAPDDHLCQGISVTEGDVLVKKKKKSKKSKSKSLTEHGNVNSVANYDVTLITLSRDEDKKQNFINIGKSFNSEQLITNKKRKHSSKLDCKPDRNDIELVTCDIENCKCDHKHVQLACSNQVMGKIKTAKKKKLKEGLH